MVDDSLELLIQELAKNRGLDFRGYKRNSLERRLRKRMDQLKVHTFEEYAQYIHQNPVETNDLLQTVLINVTTFFRDPGAWEALRKDALPELLDHLRPGDKFRAWCAGCASGEEVYSLAILLAEYLGPKIKSYDIKIYATDPDGDALNIARRGEYAAERVRNVSPELKAKYFQGGNISRINREIRRLAIFGHSNLVSDAPISHVDLLICRNVLIYFDLALQKHLMSRFRYALDEGGVLFLGKAESQLRESQNFRVINAKWRIFQCVPKGHASGRAIWADGDKMQDSKQELETLQTLQRNIMGTLRQAVLVLDQNDVVMTANDAALQVWDVAESLTGKRVFDTVLVERSRELGDYLQRSHVAGNDLLEFNIRIQINGERRSLLVTVRAVQDQQKKRIGTLIYAEDVSHQEKLRTTVQELETTAEELHSSNEELETTNEELQSANEELETTNEELQSTNEELETTNEELHSLNEELETTNDELEMRTRELDEINRRYSETLEHMPSPIMVVNEEGKIVLWNSAAQRLFGLESRAVVGLSVQQLPLTSALRSMLVRRVKAVQEKQNSTSVTAKAFRSETFKGSLEVHFTPVNSPSLRAVLVIIKPNRAPRPVGSEAKRGARNGQRTVPPARRAKTTSRKKKTRSKR